MGASVQISGYEFPLRDFRITEDSTPVAGSDSTGSTGSISLTIGSPDPDLEYTQDTGMKWLRDFGPFVLQGRNLVFEDPRWGRVEGTVISANPSGQSGISIEADTKLNRLNSYNVTAQPFRGTLGDLIRYYVSLAGADLVANVDSALNGRPVAVPGWVGELWYHFKMLAIAHEFEIALAGSGEIVFRTLRQRDARKGRITGFSPRTEAPSLAQRVEAYQYNNRAINNELVYPPGGWNSEEPPEVMNVRAGEVSEYTLELSASVSAIQQPIMVEFVSKEHSSSSRYTVVANDGLPISPAAWAAYGGSLEVTIDPDTTHLNIVIRGAEGLPLRTGSEAATLFQIALEADGSRYSTFRIVGTGVAYDKQLKTFRTGVNASQTGTEVGLTIDNPFLSTKSQCYRAGVRAAVDYAGPQPSVSFDMTHVVQRGSDHLGNLNGIRVYDELSGRWYRSRSVTVTPAAASSQFADDLLHGDLEQKYYNQTYGDVQASRNGLTYLEDWITGLK